MKISRGTTLAVLLFSSVVTCRAQSVPGVPMSGKIQLEQSLDGRRFQLVSETAYFRDSLGRVRAEETRFDANGVVVARAVRLARIEDGQLVIYTLAAGSKGATRSEHPQAELSVPPPPAHKHPEDGTRFGNRCVVGVQRYSDIFPGIEILRCDKISPGSYLRFQKDGLVWRESWAEAQAGEPHYSLFEVRSRVELLVSQSFSQRLQNEALHKFYELQPPAREQLLLPSPPTPLVPELRRPTFVPGQECDEFRLAGKELVTWNCKGKGSPLQRTRKARAT